MENAFFTWIVNHTDKKYTVIGAMSAEQEQNLVSLIANLKKENGIDLNRSSFNMDVSFNEQQYSYEDIKDFQFVPANELIKNYNFINIEDTFNV